MNSFNNHADSKLFDNVFVKFFLIFLPFTYALTLNLKFPLKISEVALLVLILFILLFGKIRSVFINSGPVKIFFIFIVFISLSMVVNMVWKYPYPLTEYKNRFGYNFDSLLKFFYLCLSFFTFFISSNAFFLNQDRYIRYFLLGGLITSVYGWYLFFSGLFGMREFILPGIEEPQYIAISWGTFLRSGTFKEGNYMGLFLLFCVIFSFYTNRKLLGYYFAASLLPTFSSIGFICVVFFLLSHLIKKNFTKRKFINLLIIVAILFVGFISLLPTKDFRYLILSKIDFRKTDIENSADYSRLDRINSIVTAIKIGMNNPIFGVGISNYARHYTHFNENKTFYTPNFKGIANNIYAEIFAEIGLPGLGLFLYLLYLLYEKTKFDKSGILRGGMVATLIYFLAFPTFSILYIWVYFGSINSIAVLQSKSSK